ncbi:MAG: hypothetical protein V3T18_10110 [Pseudomonadales bacterium]
MPILIRVLVVSILLSPLACTEQSADEARLQAALADPSRPEADRARDAQRKPDQIVAFWGIDSGMTVLDLFAAGGYYTEVLAAATGPDGKVYAHNNNFLLTVRDGVYDKEMTTRLADSRLPNVERLDREVQEMNLEPESLDAINFVLNYHDVYGFTEEAGGTTEAVLGLFKSLLKPGGVLGIIDHSANPGPYQSELHRIDENIVIEEVTGAGFVLEAQSDLLRNPDDDRTRLVFDPELRGHTDRFVLLFRKPAVPAP